MRDHGTPVPLPVVDAEVLGMLRDACDAVGFTEERIDERMAPPSGGDGREQRPVRLRRLSGRDPLAILARLLLLGEPVEERDAGPALAPAPLAQLADAGLVAVDGGQVRALFQLAPCDGLLLISDWKEPGHDPAGVVLGVSLGARVLAWLTPRREVGAALDLGTGGGIQALLAARHAGAVAGVDANPRALALARLNATINRSGNVTWHEGSWLEPVAERRFDLIVANPPYVVSPDAELLYRDSGLPGDELSRQLVTDVPVHLVEGGIALVFCNWVHPAGDWAAPLRRWVEGSGCDAVLVRYRSDDPLSYAAKWNNSLREADPSAYERAIDRWLRYYAAAGIDAIGAGFLALRRHGTITRVRALEATRYPTGPVGNQLVRMLDAVAYLDRDDSRLLDDTFQFVNGHRVVQTLTFTEGSYRSHPARVLAVPGTGVEAAADPDALNALFACDGTTPLRLLLAQRSVTGERRVAAVLDAVRQLVGAGLLEPRQ